MQRRKYHTHKKWTDLGLIESKTLVKCLKDGKLSAVLRTRSLDFGCSQITAIHCKQFNIHTGCVFWSLSQRSPKIKTFRLCAYSTWQFCFSSSFSFSCDLFAFFRMGKKCRKWQTRSLERLHIEGIVSVGDR